MFYDIYSELCKNNNLTPSGGAAKIGFNRASVTVWKNTGKPPKQELLLKIANYFNVTTDYLLTGETEKKPTTLTGSELDQQLGDIEFALYGEVKELTDGQKRDVLKFVQFIKQKGDS